MIKRPFRSNKLALFGAYEKESIGTAIALTLLLSMVAEASFVNEEALGLKHRRIREKLRKAGFRDEIVETIIDFYTR